MNKNLRYLWLVLATVIGFFVGCKWNIPLLAWIAPVFLIRFFRDSDKADRNFLLMWLASTGCGIVSWRGATALRACWISASRGREMSEGKNLLPDWCD